MLVASSHDTSSFITRSFFVFGDRCLPLWTLHSSRLPSWTQNPGANKDHIVRRWAGRDVLHVARIFHVLGARLSVTDTAPNTEVVVAESRGHVETNQLGWNGKGRERRKGNNAGSDWGERTQWQITRTHARTHTHTHTINSNTCCQ